MGSICFIGSAAGSNGLAQLQHGARLHHKLPEKHRLGRWTHRLGRWKHWLGRSSGGRSREPPAEPGHNRGKRTLAVLICDRCVKGGGAQGEPGSRNSGAQFMQANGKAPPVLHKQAQLTMQA